MENLSIDNNDALTIHSGLVNLKSRGQELFINYNSNLVELGLNKLCSVNGDFSITKNNGLCESLAEDLRGQVENCIGGGVGGDVEVSDNGICP